MKKISRIGLLMVAFVAPALVFGQGDSLAKLNEILARDPNNAAALADRARLHLMRGRNREAIADATASLRLNAKNAGAFGTRGLALDRLHDFPHAVADYTESLRLHPTALKFRLRGRCYEMLRQHEKAVADFREAQRLDREANDQHARRERP